MNSLDEQLKETLSKVLPSLQAQAVCEQLEMIPKLQKDLEQSKSQYNYVNDSYGKCLLEIDELKKKLDACEAKEKDLQVREDMLVKRELECEQAERNLEVALLKKQLEMEQIRNDDLFTLTAQVFKSPVFKQSGSTTIMDGYGNSRQLPFEQMSQQADAEVPFHRHTLLNDKHSNETGPAIKK